MDITNLNRQILFNKDDVGRRKVDAASDGLRHHLLDTGEICHGECVVGYKVLCELLECIYPVEGTCSLRVKSS